MLTVCESSAVLRRSFVVCNCGYRGYSLRLRRKLLLICFALFYVFSGGRLRFCGHVQSFAVFSSTENQCVNKHSAGVNKR